MVDPDLALTALPPSSAHAQTCPFTKRIYNTTVDYSKVPQAQHSPGPASDNTGIAHSVLPG